jgi:hypothetical protein
MHALQLAVLFFHRLHLADHPSPLSPGAMAFQWLDIHAAILGPPFVKRRVTHSILAA